MLLVYRKHWLFKTGTFGTEKCNSLCAGFEISGAVMSSTSWLVIFNNPLGDEGMAGPSFMVIIANCTIHVFGTVFIESFLNTLKWRMSTNFIPLVPDYTERGKWDLRRETETSLILKQKCKAIQDVPSPPRNWFLSIRQTALRVPYRGIGSEPSAVTAHGESHSR